MEIRHLSLRNIRSYERAELDLPSGTTLIAGDVGAGKTSLLYAVEMALFGFAAVDAPFLIRHGAVHADVTVTLAGHGHTYEVGRRFRRVNRKGRDSFEIERLTFAQDGARTVYSATELRQRVIDLFGFPDNPNPRSHSDLWRWAVYVPQERMREVLSQEPLERLETVRRALGVERYRLAADNAQDVATEIRQLSRFRREESDRLSHWESELAERSRELDASEVRSVELTKACQTVEEELAHARETLEQNESRLRSADGDRREQEGLEREQTRDREHAMNLSQARDTIDAELAREPSVGEDAVLRLDERVAAFEATLRHTETEREQIARARAVTEARVRDLIQARTDVSALTRALAERARQRSAAVEEDGSAIAELERARGEGPAREPPEPTPRTVAEIEGALETARQEERATSDVQVRARAELEEVDRLLAAGECPRCHQTVRPADFGRHRETAALALKVASDQVKAIGEVVARLEEERRSRERFERARERWQEAERRRASSEERARAVSVRRTEAEEAFTLAQESLRVAETKVTSLTPVLETEASELKGLRELESKAKEAGRQLEEARRERVTAHDASIRRERRLAERERNVADLATLNARLREREDRIALLGSRTLHLPEIASETEMARQREEETRQRLENLRLERARVDQDSANARQRRQEAEQGVAERAALLFEVRELEAKAAWLGGPFREALLAMEQRILAQAQATFQRDFGRFFRALIDDPLLEARVGAGFDPTVLINGAWTPAEALSGGERTALALAFRLALGRVVRTMGSLKLDTLILDEPTDGFSPEQIVRMGELLRSLSLPQLILVSHESQLSAVADHVTMAVKNHGRSELEVVGRPTPTESLPDAIEVKPPARRRRPRPPAKTGPDKG
jgi:exonuclease SbcC